MGNPRVVIRDYRFKPDKALENRNAIIAAEKETGNGRVVSSHKGEVIQPYYPRDDIPAGDPMSPGGTKVTLEELDDDVLEAIAAGAVGALRIREIDGAPDVVSVDDLVVPVGTLTDLGGGGARLSFRPDVDYIGKFETAAIGTGDVPEGKWAWWYNTVSGEMFLVRNRGGTLMFVETTN